MLIEDYIVLGLELDKHISGLVDAYFGPLDIADKIRALPPVEPAELAERARMLLGSLDVGERLDDGPYAQSPQRRKWLRYQLVGLLTTAEKLSGVPIDYVTEVERCYGVLPRRVSKDEIEEAISILNRIIPGMGDLRNRLWEYRESFVVPPDKLSGILGDLSEVLRSRTNELFGLPEGEAVTFEVVTSKPWSGFNYYLGDLRSKVAINADLPILSTSLAHLVAHEAYPGHHTEHSRKEVGLVRKRRQLEESIFLVGTPQCLIAEGLADFGLEILLGCEQFKVVSELMRKRGINFPDQELEETKGAFETLGKVRANAAWDLHQDGVPKEEVVVSMERDALLPRVRAEKSVEFLTDPTWRAYITCYVEGYQLVRSFVGDPELFAIAQRVSNFTRLISEQLSPADLSS